MCRTPHLEITRSLTLGESKEEQVRSPVGRRDVGFLLLCLSSAGELKMLLLLELVAQREDRLCPK